MTFQQASMDCEGRMLAQAVTDAGSRWTQWLPLSGFFWNDFLQHHAAGRCLVTNDPWRGTGHLNDFTVVTPTFLDDRIVALFACTTHVVDVGGKGIGPDGRQIYEEGINIPIMRLAEKGCL